VVRTDEGKTAHKSLVTAETAEEAEINLRGM